MTHKVDMVMDFQYGSTGKGLIAGYLAKREQYDTVVCSFATNAGHTYIDKERGIHVMTQQLPTGAISSPTVKNILIGPGALIHAQTLANEISQNAEALKGKRILIHPHAAVVEDYHAKQEIDMGMTKIGSTAKGCGAAAMERIQRSPDNPNIAVTRFFGTPLFQHVATLDDYRDALNDAENVLVEGAQGFSLSMYHGQYPYTTSRDVTPWQIAADCGLPYRWASYVQVIGAMRTYPIRVNNRDGSSGPCYRDQNELQWDDLRGVGIAPELTTVTKLKRRIFTFSALQAEEASFHCGGYWDTKVFLNFANYCSDMEELARIIKAIETPTKIQMNPSRVAWTGWGPDDSDVREYSGVTK
ncbi:adenylosuccinate synthetase [uncultured Caudovirales phage]|uniref:N6-succino-2-amino-2'-deoxyadenylate synthase n=1 Tax=uncultured Caudovirales phage TaxID=2100421 RepID=A0A6J5PGK8_9CAUD|nr:adenylosuccinate synthetase [uncultured Caudovirales phage]